MALQLAAVIGVSFIAHLESHSVLWMVAGAMSVFTGLYWFDTFTTNLGLAFGLGFLIYGLVCFEIAFRDLYIKFRQRFSKDDE